jgi:hypothetical protein
MTGVALLNPMMKLRGRAIRKTHLPVRMNPKVPATIKMMWIAL